MAELNEDGTEGCFVDFNVDIARNKNVEIRRRQLIDRIAYRTYCARSGTLAVTMLSCLRISIAKALDGGVVCISVCPPIRMPAYTSRLFHRHGRKNRLRLWHTLESDSSTCLRAI